GGVAEDGDDHDADSRTATPTPTSAPASSADRYAGQDELRDRSGPARAYEDSEGHQDGEGRGSAADDECRRCRYERHEWRLGRSRRCHGWYRHCSAGGEAGSPEGTGPRVERRY